MLYQAQKQFAKAEPLLKEVLETRMAKLEADHPDTLLSKHNLALLYRAQGKYAKAEPLLRDAVDARTGRNWSSAIPLRKRLCAVWRIVTIG